MITYPLTNDELKQFLTSEDIRDLLVKGKISDVYRSAMWAFGSQKLPSLSKALLTIMPDLLARFDGDIPTACFIGCHFADPFITIPETVTNIGKEAFRNSNIGAVHSDSVVDFGYSAFQNCYRLSTVYIGLPCQFISSYAFAGCTNLKDIYYEGPLDHWMNKIKIMGDAFQGVEGVLHCYDANVDFLDGQPIIRKF